MAWMTTTSPNPSRTSPNRTTTTRPSARSRARTWHPPRRPLEPGVATVPSRRRTPPPAPGRAPTPSEKAVHVREDVSKVFVIATAVVFTAILLNGLLLGNGGLLTAAPAPTAEPERVRGSIRKRVGRPIAIGVARRVGVCKPVGRGVGRRLRARLDGAIGLTQPVRRTSAGRILRTCPATRAPLATERGWSTKQLRGPRDPRRTRPRRHGRDPARAVHRRSPSTAGLRRRGGPDRRRADDQSALDGRADDRAARAAAGRSGPRAWHWLRVPGSDPGLARGRCPQPRAPPELAGRHATAASGCSTCLAVSRSESADGSLGAPDDAPFDGIIVTAAAPADPRRAARPAGGRGPARHPGWPARSADPDSLRFATGMTGSRPPDGAVRVRAADRAGRVRG